MLMSPLRFSTGVAAFESFDDRKFKLTRRDRVVRPR